MSPPINPQQFNLIQFNPVVPPAAPKRRTSPSESSSPPRLKLSPAACKLFLISLILFQPKIFLEMNGTAVPGRRKGGRNGGWGGGSASVWEQFHKEGLLYLWTVGINLAILLAMYRYRKYTMLLHFLMGLGVAATTLLYSLPLLLQNSIPAAASPLRTHMLVGIAILAVICLEVVLGCACKVVNLFRVPSVLLHYMNKSHLILGYALAALCKFQYYYIAKDRSYAYWLLVGQDLLFALLFVARKRLFPLLQHRIQPVCAVEDVKAISCLAELEEKADGEGEKEMRDYCSFGNLVYEMSPMRLVHPAGYQILQAVRNREVDRFIYGMSRAELLPRLPAHSHSFKSLDLLGAPIARIAIACPYPQMPEAPFPVSVAAVRSVSYHRQIYQVELSSETPLGFAGYSCLEQLGRFYSLTVNAKVTRLYTAVNFLHASNVQLLRSLGVFEVGAEEASGAEIEMQTERAMGECRRAATVPLLVKVYEGGTLPNLIIANRAETLMLSPPKGFGLRLAEAPPGTILMLAGGTGLYPFSDLIDLLFKDGLVSQGHHMTENILQKNPVLRSHPFAPFRFRLLLACQSLADLHPITLAQLTELAKSAKLELKVKAGKGEQLAGASALSGRFEGVLEEELRSLRDLSRVWVCGPPSMSQAVAAFFEQHYKDADFVHLL